MSTRTADLGRVGRVYSFALTREGPKQRTLPTLPSSTLDRPAAHTPKDTNQ